MIGWLAMLIIARWLAVFVAAHPLGPSEAAAEQEATLRSSWLWAVSAAAGECAIYGGMAAGNGASGVLPIWPLAVGTVIGVATAELLGACLAVQLATGPLATGRLATGRLATGPLATGSLAHGPLANGLAEWSGQAGVVLRWTARFLRLPAGVRGSIALLGFAITGADGAFFAVLACSVLPIAATVVMLGKIAPSERGTVGRSGSVARPASVRRPASAQTSASVQTPASELTEGAAPPPDSAQRGFIWARSAGSGRVPHRSVPRRTPSPEPVSSVTIIGGPGSRSGSSTDGRAGEDGRAGGDDRARGTARPGPMGYAGGITAAGGAAGQAKGRHQANVVAAGSAARPGAAEYQADVPEARETAGPMRHGDQAADGPAGGSITEPVTASRAEPGEASRGEGVPGGAPSGRLNTGPAARDVVLALRDDGAAARWAGRLVQGNLIPLPPALAGLVATSLLAVLGARDLAGFIVLTPPVVMMLAAPGSSHPHDRRFDWLVPVLLGLAQYVYVAPLGFGLSIPGPVIFSACALIFLWYTGVIAEKLAGSARGTSIGWETRMFAIGLAATFGLGPFGYVGLATYLGVLICRKVVTGYPAPREEDRQ
jgi:hypothetical protein